MDKFALKARLLEKCLEQINHMTANLKEAMDEAQRAANEYGPPKDRYDSFRTQLLRKRDMFAQQLAKIHEQAKAVQRIPHDELKQKVEYGAVVFTENQKIFIATAIGKIDFEGDTYFIISPVVPIFKAMQDKKAGEGFVFNGQTSKIIEVF